MLKILKSILVRNAYSFVKKTLHFKRVFKIYIKKINLKLLKETFENVQGKTIWNNIFSK